MTWLGVSWTEARQILAICEVAPPPDLDAAATPEQGLAALCAAGALEDAVAYLGAALPRQRAIDWAARIVGPAGADARDSERQALLDAVGRWLADPDEGERRAAWDLASRHAESCPERLLASAVFFSGGSIAPDGCESVRPQPDLCGRLAAASVLALAYDGSHQPEAVLQLAVAEGDRIASS